MLTVHVPYGYPAERAYAVSVLLGEFLGLSFQILPEAISTWRITLADSNLSLVLADSLFGQGEAVWLTSDSLPSQPLPVWHYDHVGLLLENQRCPVIYGHDPTQPEFFTRTAPGISLGLDIFGSAFFMLTRYEEVVKLDRDKFDRFPAKAALAYQEGFLDRPVVNEYLEILWACLKSLWPGLVRNPRQFQMYVSHDVDEPFRFAFSGVRRLLQRCAGDLLYRKSLPALVGSVNHWSQVKLLNRSAKDPANTFDLIMDLSERHNLRSAFYFITDHSAGAIDGDYSMEHPLMRQLLRRVHDRGHEVGLHTSYHTYQDPQQTEKEFAVLQRVCQEEKIEQLKWGGRQHYLRWQTPVTWQNWDAAGLDYDSTLTYADCIGFRCGTCYEFPVFDLLTRQALRLRERPLCVMDVTVTRPAYMGLKIEDGSAFRAMLAIKNRCRRFSGDFTLLWHNTGFVNVDELVLYEKIISS
jgi:peptidoglycan/xylan/chitin deacetylase (PgdA/CDA1 family)